MHYAFCICASIWCRTYFDDLYISLSQDGVMYPSGGRKKRCRVSSSRTTTSSVLFQSVSSSISPGSSHSAIITKLVHSKSGTLSFQDCPSGRHLVGKSMLVLQAYIDDMDAESSVDDERVTHPARRFKTSKKRRKKK